MNVSVEETGPVERRVHVEIPTTDVDAAFEAFYREVRRSAHIKGFRPGKTPREVLEKYFAERASGEVLERLVGETLGQAIAEKELDVLGEPRLQPGEPPKPGARFAYDADVDVRPAIEVQKVRGLDVARPVLPVPERDPVDAHLEELRQRQAQLVEEASGSAAARGNVAVVDYVGKIDGKPFAGSSAREAQVEIGSGRTFGGFEDELVGMQVGDERAFDIAMPADHEDEALRGKSVRFEVKLVALKRREVPELDDEFAKDVSSFATLAELRADLDKRVAEGRTAEQKRLERAAVIEALLAANPFPVPPRLVEAQVRARIGRMLSQFRNARLSREALEGLVERWSAELRPQVESDVKLALLAPAIAKAESLEVSDEDVDRELQKIAEASQRPFGETKREYRERGLLDAVRAGIAEEKAVELALGAANLSDA
ncbi:MAG TPA: trigger factor [Myxococcota bacterium]|nr:trigger factor [Myxococcota bacterium]